MANVNIELYTKTYKLFDRYRLGCRIRRRWCNKRNIRPRYDATHGALYMKLYKYYKLCTYLSKQNFPPCPTRLLLSEMKGESNEQSNL